jgi:homoserine kinase
MQKKITVRVPATTANLGPGFDCLGLALDLWNEAVFSPGENETRVEIEGEGAGVLAQDGTNLVIKAAAALFERIQQPMPAMHVHCHNHIPMSSGLGSSAATRLLGLLGANAVAGNPLKREEILKLAIELEGHPDNATACLYGGLVLAVEHDKCSWLVRRFDLPLLKAVVVLPEIDLPTHTARKALPAQVTMKDAVFNIGRAVLVVDALQQGDVKRLGEAMDDRLHQPYRLPLIAGGVEALSAARQGGAAAAISGAGPSLIAFTTGDPVSVGRAMMAAFQNNGIKSRAFSLQTSNRGAEVEP